MHIIDEILLANSNTKEMMEEVNRKYPGRHGVVHPDPSGVARKTSAPVGQTDFTIIEEAGWPVYRTSAYPLIDTSEHRQCNALQCSGSSSIARKAFLHESNQSAGWTDI